MIFKVNPLLFFSFLFFSFLFFSSSSSSFYDDDDFRGKSETACASECLSVTVVFLLGLK